MSFFGLEQRRGLHPAQAPGFGSAPDPFASISQNRDREGDDDDAIDFEDTYDGLGDDLDEADDDFNDDTFGGGESNGRTPGKDFDFHGNTSKVSNAINEDAIIFNRHQPPARPLLLSSGAPKQSSRSFKTGYEAYKNPSYMPDLQVDASLWGTTPQQAQPSNALQQQSSKGPTAKKMMTLEEIEAGLASHPVGLDMDTGLQQQSQPHATPSTQTYAYHAPHHPFPPRTQNLPLPQSQNQHSADQLPAQTQTKPRGPLQAGHQISRSSQVELPSHASPANEMTALPPPQAPQILQRGQPLHQPTPDISVSSQPQQILQNPNRQQPHSDSGALESMSTAQMQTRMMAHRISGTINLPIITHPSQLAQLTDEQRQAFMIEDAKRAKRNHKIYLLSKNNGLMTPQDKNFITRIQLQQLLTTTGNTTDQDQDSSLAEDFYYQVYNQIENRPRQSPHQPLNNFAQTYLFQTGGRNGQMGRRQYRGGDNHMHRMQQQVQRAVEAAKLKPKNKQLVIEGSLGKISFSNAKTPKPLLNIKRHESSDVINRPGSKKLPQSTLSTTDRKAILKNIEKVYSTLMRMEDHDRCIPPRPTREDESAASQRFLEWHATFLDLNQKLWSSLKVMEPIMPESTILHPFIALLSYPKGKKAIPRIFSHIDQEQRLTILTIIMVQLDSLDVIRSGQPHLAANQSPIVAREQVDVFLHTVMPSLFSYVTEAPFNIVIGLLGLVIDRTNLHAITRTQVGLEVLTMFMSQAEIIRKSGVADDAEWEQWLKIYNRLFDTMEPILFEIFPGSVSAGQDVYVWQFLATLGTGANPEQQQRLVLAVKDRVMETVQQSKTLPADMAAQRRGNVNLFMQAIGLDVDLLDG